MTFYRIETDAEGRAVISTTERVAGPGYDLDGSRPADRAKSAGGWKWYDTAVAFLASPEVVAATVGLQRTRMEAAGLDPEVLAEVLDPTFGLPVPKNGRPWVQPLGVVGAYPQGATVTTPDGKTWESLSDWNVQTPGVSGWREVVTPGSAPAEWKAPLGSGDAYKKGDKVTFEGAVWVSTVDANVWKPGVYGWTKTA